MTSSTSPRPVVDVDDRAMVAVPGLESAAGASDVVVRDRRLALLLSILCEVTAACRVVHDVRERNAQLRHVKSAWRVAMHTAASLEACNDDEGDDHDACHEVSLLMDLWSHVELCRTCLVRTLWLGYMGCGLTDAGHDRNLMRIREDLTVAPTPATPSDGRQQRSFARRLLEVPVAAFPQEEEVGRHASQSDGGHPHGPVSPYVLLGLRQWMTLGVVGDGSTAALRLLSRCEGLMVSGLGDAWTVEQPTDPACTCSEGHAPPQREVFAVKVVVSNRTVAPCHHTDPCMGNHQFLLVSAEDISSAANDCDMFPPAVDDVPLCTVLARCCSLSHSPHEWGNERDRTVRFGELLEKQLPDSDQRSRPWAASSGPGLAPSCSPPEVYQWSIHDTSLMALPFYDCGQADGYGWELRGDGTRRRKHHHTARKSGPRAGDAIFAEELRARLEFWSSRGAQPRNYDVAWRELAHREQIDVDGLATEAWWFAVDTSEQNGLVTLGCRVELELMYFSTRIGTVEVTLLVPNREGPARVTELLSKLRSVQLMLKGCILSVTMPSRSHNPSKGSAPSPKRCREGSLSDEDWLRSINSDGCGQYHALVSQIHLSEHASSNGSCATCRGRLDTSGSELRKLQHRLLLRHDLLRGVLWDASEGRVKMGFSMRRLVTTSTKCLSKFGASAEAARSPVALTGCTFVVDLSPLVHDTLMEVKSHTGLLVDLDRTLVDNAITLADCSRPSCTRGGLHERDCVAFQRALSAVEAAQLVSWVVATKGDEHFKGGDSGVVLTPRERSAMDTHIASSVLGEGSSVKRETIFCRPGAAEWLSLWSREWGVPIMLVTKSSFTRAASIVAQVMPQVMTARSNPNPAVCIFAAEDIMDADESLRHQNTGERRTADYAEALIRSKKHAAEVIRRRAALWRNQPNCDDGDELQAALRVVVVDDAPHAWAEDDWPRTVAVDPYTLSHVDPVAYWAADGYVSYAVLQRFITAPALNLSSTEPRQPALDTTETSPWDDDNDTDGEKQEQDSLSSNDEMLNNAPQAVVEDSDDEDEVRHDRNSNDDWGTTPTLWSDNPNVEDVVPL